MTYGDLQTNFLNLLNRRDCSTSQAQTFLQMSIQRIQRELRCPAMEKIVLATIGAGYAGLTIPSDLLELIDLIPITANGGSGVTNQERLEKCDISKANMLALNVAIPEFYARDGGVWLLGPAPSVGDTIKIKYYAELAPLVNSTDTNIMSIIAWDLIVYGALTYAGDFYTDKRTAGWEARFGQIKDDLQTQGDDDEESGAACVQPAFAYPDDTGDWDYPYPIPGGF